jgi:hypothetical protein
MTLILAVTSAQASADAVVDKVDAGSAAGTLKIYSGSQPATPETAPTGTLLVTFTLNDAAFGSADSTGTAALVVSPAISATAAASGTAGYGRIADSDGNAVFDGEVGTSGAVFNLTTTAIVSGQTVDCNSGSYQQPTGA